MKNTKLFLAFLVTIFCASQAFSQYKFEGVVVEVSDGKTVVIDAGQSKRMVAELQGIEVPEQEQELHQTVVDHLRKLLMGKQVKFYPAGWTLPKIKGQLVADGVDVSQQMLRDGAAWYAPGGSLDYAYLYKTSEAQAKAENRGVWSVKGLKPAWEFRQEKAEMLKKQQEEAAKKALEEEEKVRASKYAVSDSGKKVSVVPVTAKTSVEKWEANPFAGKGQNLVYKYDAANNSGYVSTPMMKFDVFDGKKSHPVMIALGYDFAGQTMEKGGKIFGLAIGDLSGEKNFLRENNVVVTIGKNTKLDFGKAEIKSSKEAEMVLYKVSRQNLEKLAAADNAVLNVGKYKRVLDKSVMNLARKILAATE